ncbi:hypothetical protein P3X46_018111 [Hevea brasiliensis]|nr:putative wall-associated receptor kinase-like 16 isoform X2 [Hevea brasiliensis]KAJ9169974.1 hypothetical protein P3X46_018111 [Hevea brasiliensis]
MNTAKDVNSCSGVGCCQTSIPDGLQSFEIGIGSMSNYSKKLSSICNYALLIDHLDPSLGSILKTNLNHHPANTTIKTHVVVDWVIDNKTCVAASTESSLYACGLNTLCIDYNSGYRCVCKEGFQGNPYLQGCEDINECLSPQIYPCDGSCTNTEGNYACRCPPFMHGDGKLSCKGIRIATLAAGISSGFGLILLFVAFYVLHKYMRKKRQIRCRKIIFKKNGGLLLEQQISSSNEGKLDRARIFTAEELEKATDSYNENRILGRGGQGTVYKGMLTDGTVVAVKKSGKMDQDQSQTVHFINELVILSQINHKHVVKLLGCCLETQVPLIVYEFISNGTLWSHLHDHSEEEFLPLRWSDRLRIAREVAMALAYMHSSASIPIYHRDIKSSNILLDEKLRAKVSDFGISRSVPGEKTHLTTLVQGTFGYLDPEYFQSNQYTDKSDVYSYGVVLVELLTRQKPIPSTIIEGERGLAAEFMSAIEENRLYDVVDPQVLAEGEERELIVVANLAKECLRLNGKRRPTMPDVVLELENLERSQNHLPPKHNSFWNEDYIETSRKWDANSTQNEIRGFMMMSRKELDQLPLLEDDDDDVSNESYQHITT